MSFDLFTNAEAPGSGAVTREDLERNADLVRWGKPPCELCRREEPCYCHDVLPGGPCHCSCGRCMAP